MDCGNVVVAYEALEKYGYYRLSGYWHPYRKFPVPPEPTEDDKGREIRLEDFENGTTFSKIVDIYMFDQELRAKLGQVLSAIEVAFRFFVGHRMGKLDPFIHRKPELFGNATLNEDGDYSPSSSYSKWLAEFDRQERRAKSSFVQHFREKYGEHLPLWVATEVMSFGALSQFYNLMPLADRRILADRLQISRPHNSGKFVGEVEVLSNWLNGFRHARNLCSHYSRIWNRVYDVTLSAPGAATEERHHVLGKLADKHVNNRLYGLLLALRYALLSIAPNDSQVLEIVRYLSTKCSALGLKLSDAGFPSDWQENEIRSETYSLIEAPMLAGSLLDRVEMASASEIRKLLDPEKYYPSNYSAEKRIRINNAREMLRAYKRYGVVIGCELGDTTYYPVFQFVDGAIRPEVADINLKLRNRCQESDDLRITASLIEWWLIENPPTSTP